MKLEDINKKINQHLYDNIHKPTKLFISCNLLFNIGEELGHVWSCVDELKHMINLKGKLLGLDIFRILEDGECFVL